jgi:hypothetical protein
MAIVLLLAFLPAVSAANTGIVSVVSTPAGARVFVDGNYEGTTPWKGIFPPGTHTLRLTHPEYAEYETTFALQPLESKELNIQMGALAPLSVSSSPVGANVYLNGIWQGYTNLEIASVALGDSYAVRIVRDGYEPFETSVVIQKDTRIHADLVPLRTTGTLSVTSVPAEARVLVDGAMAGLTPYAGTVGTGSHTVTVKRIRYHDYTTTVTVETGKTTTVSAVLNLAARAEVQSAEVSVLSTPPGASVYIDGVYYGPAPVAADLEPAAHTIRVSLPGYTDYALNVTVAAGESLPVYANLGGGSTTVAGTPSASGTGTAGPQATRASGFGWVPALAGAAACIALLKKAH